MAFSLAFLLLCFALSLHNYVGAIQLHNPPGSSNRNREQSLSSTNGARLFDSQTDPAAGYPWRGDPTLTAGDPLTYYQGSVIRVEWTLSKPVHERNSDIILQAACEEQMPGLRDGYPQGPMENIVPTNPGYTRRSYLSNNQDGTDEITLLSEVLTASSLSAFTEATNRFYLNGSDHGGDIGSEYGMHESHLDYYACTRTERNKGLYTGDYSGKDDARGTRANPSGSRSGLECPEERDYYPYWRTVPWGDIAIIVDGDRCPYYLRESHNVKSRYECQGVYGIGETPIEESKCISTGGSWVEIPPLTGRAPDCIYYDRTRDNDLSSGNAVFHEDVTIPDWMEGSCVFRVRHNISTPGFENLDAKHNNMNCTFNGCEELRRLLATDGLQLSFTSIPLALDVAQPKFPFEVHEDRSFVFKVAKRPPEIPTTARILNLNYRGMRADSVRSYPSLTYSFVPQHLHVHKDDYLHIQFHGSNFNAANMQHQGWQHSDRTNLIQTEARGSFVPRDPLSSTVAAFFPDTVAGKLAEVGMNTSNCVSFDPSDAAGQQDGRNCAVLNAAPPRFEMAPFQVTDQPLGDYHFMSTRDSQLTERLLTITVQRESSFTSSSTSLRMGDIVVVSVWIGLLLAF